MCMSNFRGMLFRRCRLLLLWYLIFVIFVYQAVGFINWIVIPFIMSKPFITCYAVYILFVVESRTGTIVANIYFLWSLVDIFHFSILSHIHISWWIPGNEKLQNDVLNTYIRMVITIFLLHSLNTTFQSSILKRSFIPNLSKTQRRQI